MILRSLSKTMVGSITTKPHYNQSRLQKILYMIRRVLNKMANEETRSFKQPLESNPNENVPQQVQQTKPASMEEATKLFLRNQNEIAAQEKNRLARIDDILGTKTYFHETKIYQQRISNDSVLQLSYLEEKHKEMSRQEIDILNPQSGLLQKLLKSRKHKKNLVNLKKYPVGNTDLVDFEQKPTLATGSDNTLANAPLINFLGEEELFVRLALSDLNFTIDSINSQKLETIKDGQVINLQLEEEWFVHNQQIYFRPLQTLSIYRIDIKHFNRNIVHSVEALAQALTAKLGNIQEVVSLDEIYECLQTFYYDERVNDYLRRVENEQLGYLFSSLEVSPDGNSIFLVIDLLDNMKEFVGLYKQLSSVGDQVDHIRPENALFNFRPEVALRNDGILYYVQRSQQGLFAEFTKTKFNTQISVKPKENLSEKEVEESKNAGKSLQKHARKDKILYRCKPFQELKLLKNTEAKVASGGKNWMSNNVLLEETDIGTVANNRIYLVLHEGADAETCQIQSITANNNRLPQLLEEMAGEVQVKVGEWEGDGKKILTECFQIMGVGYLLVRYRFVGGEEGAKLKYGHNKKYANYVTFIPYAGHKPSVAADDSIKIQDLSQSQQYLSGESVVSQGTETEQVNPELNAKVGKIKDIDLPSQESALLIDYTAQNKDYYKLQVEKERIIYISPDNHYITDLQVRHASISNVYLLINNSVQSVYNRNSLYVHSLRKNVNPYSMFLDGFPIEVVKKNIGSGEIGKLSLKLQAPLLPVNLQYTLWKKQIQEVLNDRIYTETLTIKEDEEGDIVIKIISNSRYVNRKPGKKVEVQPVILYLPSQNQRLNETVLQKMLEKGVMIVQIVKCRGIFGSTMLQLLRGSKQFYNNYIDDIYQTIIFIRENISHRLGLYAEGPSSCFATLLLNIRENSQNQLFDGTVLHEGLYDTECINERAEFFFGKDRSIFENSNPFSFGQLDPSKSAQDEQKQMIIGLSNIVFSSLQENMRVESRKFVNKLRIHKKIIYDSVYLKQFDKNEEKDIFNLAFLYKIMNEKMKVEYNEYRKQKAEEVKEEGEALSRDGKDKIKPTQNQ